MIYIVIKGLNILPHILLYDKKIKNHFAIMISISNNSTVKIYFQNYVKSFIHFELYQQYYTYNNSWII